MNRPHEAKPDAVQLRTRVAEITRIIALFRGMKKHREMRGDATADLDLKIHEQLELQKGAVARLEDAKAQSLSTRRKGSRYLTPFRRAQAEENQQQLDKSSGTSPRGSELRARCSGGHHDHKTEAPASGSASKGRRG